MADITQELGLFSPALVLTAGAFLILMLEVFLKRAWSRAAVTLVSIVGALLALAKFQAGFMPNRTIFWGALFADPYSLMVSAIILAASALPVLIGMKSLSAEGIDSESEYYSLYLMSLVGAIIFASAADLITLFLGLEIMSMALYCLCGGAIRFRRSGEAALKYFILGSFSSAFLLYGIAILYGLTGSLVISKIAEAAMAQQGALLFFALALMLVGFIFKIGAVPFHFWVPDVYEGAPTPVTAYMSCVVKAGAIAAALRVVWSGFAEFPIFWDYSISVIAGATMLIGNLVALRQRSLKRMLAYSSIAHAGYMLLAFLAPRYDGGPAIFYYLIGYSAMTMGAFAVVMAVASAYNNEKGSDDITRFNGLAARSPFLAAMMSLFMLSLAGLPPGMVGLLGKFYIFNSAISAGYVSLSILGILASAVSVYYYLRVIVAMYFIESKGDEAEPVPVVAKPLKLALLVCAVLVVFGGTFPAPLYDRLALVMKSLIG